MNDSPIDTTAAEKAWQEYVTAINVANQSRRFQDGIAAGRAWRQFLDLFMTPSQRSALEAARPE